MNNPDLLFAGAVLVGMLAHEIAAVLASAKKHNTQPSIRYYFSRPANQLQVALDGVTAIGGFLARHEVMHIASAQDFPVLTGLAMGGASAWLFARLLDFTKRSQSTDGQPPARR